MIHPTALISPDVELGQGVKVGPFAVIEGPGRIGDESIIESHAVLRPHVYLGQRNRVHPTAVLGGLPQDLSFDPSMPTRLEIGDDNIFREGVTISRATREGEATRIGSGNYFMNHTHLGHDSVMGHHNILASGATIGSYAILQGLAGINKDVMPFALVGGRPGKHYRLNLIGLRRAGIEGERLKAISAAFRRLRARQDLEGLPETEELQYLRAFLASSSRRGGLLGFIDVATRDGD